MTWVSTNFKYSKEKIATVRRLRKKYTLKKVQEITGVSQIAILCMTKKGFRERYNASISHWARNRYHNDPQWRKHRVNLSRINNNIRYAICPAFRKSHQEYARRYKK